MPRYGDTTLAAILVHTVKPENCWRVSRFFCGTLASLSAGQRWGVVNENRRLPLKPVWGIAKLLLSDAVEKLHEMTGSSRVKSLSGLA